MNNRFLKLLIIFLLFGYSFAQIKDNCEEYKYRVDFLFIPSLDITMKISCPTQFQKKNVKMLEFYTRTKKVFNHIFQINNYYKSVYDSNNFSIFYSEKIIEQPNVRQTLTANYGDTLVKYSNKKSLTLPKNTHNFFSLLMHARKINIEEMEKQSFPVDIEGHLYEARFKYLEEDIIVVGNKGILTDKIEITLFALNPDQPAVTELTDVFNWKIASNKGKREIWIEKNKPRRIIKTQFYLSPTWLTAKLVEYEK